MAETPTTEQEPRNAHVGLRVTRSEKRAIQLVAAYRDVTESDLLRELRVEDIVVEYVRLFPAQVEKESA